MQQLSIEGDFPGGSDGKESACNEGDPSPGENGNPLHYPCLENSMDRGVWQVIYSMRSQNQTQLSN